MFDYRMLDCALAMREILAKPGHGLFVAIGNIAATL